jgi:hypothetical protein
MTDQQQKSRGKNVMLLLLERRLSVPRMYLDASWQGHSVDILAIDRDGSGDVHVVLAYVRPKLKNGVPDATADQEALRAMLNTIRNVPAQYKYILGVGDTRDWQPFNTSVLQEFAESSFASDGLGRVGIAFAEPNAADTVIVNLLIFPERFRAFIGSAADAFVRDHAADWQLRA